MWNAGSKLTIASAGTGTLRIESGAQVTSSRLTQIGQSAGSEGEVIVTGPGSTLSTGTSFNIGFRGNGTLTVDLGGAASAASIALGSTVGATGIVNVRGAGSILSARGSMRLAQAGDAELHILNGGRLDIQGGLSFEASGGSSSLNYTLSAPSDPLIDVGGDADLAGTISAELAVGTTLGLGDTFTLIDIDDTQSGSFSNVAQGGMLNSFGDFALLLDYTGGDGNDVIAYAQRIGDANGDGQVTAADLVILDANFGQPGTFSDGDFNGDGVVTAADLVILDANFGAGVGSASTETSTTPIPEPNSLALLVLAGLPLARRRRTRVPRQAPLVGPLRSMNSH